MKQEYRHFVNFVVTVASGVNVINSSEADVDKFVKVWNFSLALIAFVIVATTPVLQANFQTITTNINDVKR